MASISVVSARVWARHAVAIEMATITAVAAAASLVMGGNLMINMFDVAVVGAGPAGATAALTLARRGLNVALLEKAALPRYKTCGGAVVARSLALFPPEIQTVVELRCTHAELHLLDGDLHYSSAREPPGPPIMAMTMRDRLDQVLASAATAAGAALHAPCTVSGVSLDPRHVRLDTDAGPVTAAFVIAADGATGELARLAGWGDGRHLIPALEHEVHVDDATLDRFARVPRFDVGVVPYGYAWVFPKTAHLSVGVLTTRRGAASSRPRRLSRASSIRRARAPPTARPSGQCWPSCASLACWPAYCTSTPARAVGCSGGRVSGWSKPSPTSSWGRGRTADRCRGSSRPWRSAPARARRPRAPLGRSAARQTGPPSRPPRAPSPHGAPGRPAARSSSPPTPSGRPSG